MVLRLTTVTFLNMKDLEILAVVLLRKCLVVEQLVLEILKYLI